MKDKAAFNREKRTIEAMIQIFCTHQHQQNELCADCQAALSYAYKRIDKCHFGQEKPTCNKCSVHCYSPKMKEYIRAVMRYSGPRMIYRHPIMAIHHILKESKFQLV